MKLRLAPVSPPGHLGSYIETLVRYEQSNNEYGSINVGQHKHLENAPDVFVRTYICMYTGM